MNTCYPQCLYCHACGPTAEFRRLPFGRGFKCKDLFACRERVLKQKKGATQTRVATPLP